MADPLKPVDIAPPPGIVRRSTEAHARGRWTQVQNVRFNAGLPESHGGYSRLIDQLFTGICRGMCSYNGTSGDRVLALGTHRKLYALVGGRLSNITPLRSSGALGADPIATTSGSRTVVVTHALHGLASGDAAFLGNLDPVGGIWFDGEYEVNVLTANTYEITHPVAAATATTTGGGAVATFAYEISPGLADNIDGFGYGVGPYGDATYGTPRSTAGIGLLCRTWALDNRGTRLYASPSNGAIYKWDQTDPRATLLTNAPTESLAFFLSQFGHPVALGADGVPARVRTADPDDTTDWTPDLANEALVDTIKNVNRLIGGLKLRDGTDLVFSDNAAILMIYQPTSDLIFRFDIHGTGMGIVGPNAGIEHLGAGYWMGQNDFFYWKGGIARPIPSSDDINDYVFKRISRRQLRKTVAYKFEANNEVGWLVPSEVAGENDLRVRVNTADFSWAVDDKPRTAWLQSQEFGQSIAADASGQLWVEEDGDDADGRPLEKLIVLGPIDVDAGRGIVEVLALIADMDDQVGPIEYSFLTRARSQEGPQVEEGPFVAMPGQGQVDVRASGNEVALKIRSKTLGGHFRYGRLRLFLQRLGQR